MATIIKKGLLGKEDIRFYTAASPTFSRSTSTGLATILHTVAATHIPITQATLNYSQNTVQRALSEIGEKVRLLQTPNTFGFIDASAATSIQAAASNQFLKDGTARIVIPNGTYTAATSIRLPRKCWIFGNGRGTVVRASSTTQTSAVFSITGSLGATTSNLQANATIGTQVVGVIDGTKFSKGNWVYINGGSNVEIQQIRSISGNDLTVNGLLRQTYRSAATTKSVTLLYPAELVMDNIDIQLTSATQGIGVAATYLVRSHIGKETRMSGFAIAGVHTLKSDGNTIEPDLSNPSNVGSGYGRGVRLSTSQDTIIGGRRDGVPHDRSDSPTNWVFGVNYRGPAVASGIANPIAFYYRNNKPQLGYASYGATTVVTCPASTDAPAEVYMNGRIYKNTGTVLCDLSRTIKPTAATVGGLDRGPATATTAYYIYGVPSRNSSASRQFDIIASSGNPSTGPTASATYPVWTWLSAVNTSVATIHLVPFFQNGDEIVLRKNFITSNGELFVFNGNAVATYHQVTSGVIPVSSKKVKVFLSAATTGYITNNLIEFHFADGDAVNGNEDVTRMQIGGLRPTGGSAVRPYWSWNDWVGVNSNRRLAYWNLVAASLVFDAWVSGYQLNRAAYK